MGCLTTIVIHNDAQHVFREFPEEFANKIHELINEANHKHESVSGGIKGYSNYITVFPSRHADDETIYIHKGNTVFELNRYSKDFKKCLKVNLNYVNNCLESASYFIKECKKYIKDNLV